MSPRGGDQANEEVRGGGEAAFVLVADLGFPFVSALEVSLHRGAALRGPVAPQL